MPPGCDLVREAAAAVADVEDIMAELVIVQKGPVLAPHGVLLGKSFRWLLVLAFALAFGASTQPVTQCASCGAQSSALTAVPLPVRVCPGCGNAYCGVELRQP